MSKFLGKNAVLKISAVLVGIALLIGVWFVLAPSDETAPAVHSEGIGAQYPETVPYPDSQKIESTEEFDAAYDKWFDARRDVWDKTKGYGDALEPFYQKTMAEILGGLDGGNKVYSPLSVYMSLAMLAETVDGESREQIFELLGVSDIDVLRETANKMWLANYVDDGATKSLLANSFWLDEGLDYNKSILENLANNHYASSYWGDMASEEFEKVFQQWLDEQTGGLLTDQAKKVEMGADSVMMLANTLCFSGRWQDEFRAENNTVGTFHSPNGDAENVFMNRNTLSNVYFGKGFKAYKSYFVNNTAMIFVLPDESESIDGLIRSNELTNLFYNYDDNTRYCTVSLSVPKFDVSYDADLKEAFINLGVKDVFSAEKADFSPLCSDASIALGKVNHAARVKIDEQGCTAAAFTVQELCGSAMPTDKVDFVLDRPFIFAITSYDGSPLFIGTVNNP